MATVRDLNEVSLMGHLTRDPEVKYTPNGALVCTFGVATNRQYKKADGSLAEEAEYHNIVCWGKLGEICSQLLRIGSHVWIRGELRTRTWDDTNSVKHYRTEVRATDMKLLDKKANENSPVKEIKVEEIDSSKSTPMEEEINQTLETSEDLPF